MKRLTVAAVLIATMALPATAQECATLTIVKAPTPAVTNGLIFSVPA